MDFLRSARPAPIRFPSSRTSPRRIIVVVTLDAERYTTVDITDSINDGPVIRARILNKLGILEFVDQAQALIYETEIGAVAIGEPLDNDSLASMCYERGDSRASLAFIVERSFFSPKINGEPQRHLESDSARDRKSPSPPRPQPQRPPPPTEPPQVRTSTHPSAHCLPDPSPQPPTHLNSRQGLSSRPHELSVDPFRGGGSPQDCMPRRAVRPLPAIPTPTAVSPAFPLSGGSSYCSTKVSPVVNEIDGLYE